MEAGKKGDSSLFLPPTMKPVPAMSSVLGPGWDCPRPPVVIQEGRQAWSPCQAGHSPRVSEQKRGALSLPRGTKANVPFPAFTPHTVLPPGASRKFPFLSGPTALTVNQTSASFHSCFGACHLPALPMFSVLPPIPSCTKPERQST